MAKQHPDWDDDRLFETARNTNIVELLKVIIEDYINHLSSAKFRVFVEPGLAEKQNWYRTNRICAEFDLLYRWHPLAPTDFVLDQSFPNEDFRYNNALLFKNGVEKIFDSASRQHAGKVALHNTAPYLIDAEIAALNKSRAWRIAPYNEYRTRFGLPRISSFRELTGESGLAAELEGIYGTIDNLEFTIGLLAEARSADTVLGTLMTLMVGVDAFSQALTNPLLSTHIYCDACFSEAGARAVDETSSFADIVGRNAQIAGQRISFDI
jgi:Animal haem peroxidase